MAHAAHAPRRRPRPPRPCSLARYIAASASRRSLCGPSCRSLGERDADAGDDERSLAPSSNGRASAADDPLARPRRQRPGRRGPRRRRRTRRRRSARPCRPGAARAEPTGDHRTRSSSPAPWPSESLTTLKRSRSRKSTATRRPAARRVAQRRSRRSMNSARFGSPVSGSCRRLAQHLVLRAAALDRVGQHVRGGLQEGDLVGCERRGTLGSQHAHLPERRIPASRSSRGRPPGGARADPELGARSGTPRSSRESTAPSTVRPIVTVSCSRPRRFSPSSASRPRRATAVCCSQVALELGLGPRQSRSRAPSSASAARPTSSCIRLKDRAIAPTSSRERTVDGNDVDAGPWPCRGVAGAGARASRASGRRRCRSPGARRRPRPASTAWAMMPGRIRPTVIVRMATATKMSWSREMSAGLAGIHRGGPAGVR